jgi:hypothetical protein
MAEKSNNVEEKRSTAFGNRGTGMGRSEENWASFLITKRINVPYVIPQGIISYCFCILCYFIYIYI